MNNTNDTRLGLLILVALVGVFLNHSRVTFGINMSLADPFLIASVGLFAMRGYRKIPLAFLALFIGLSLTTVATAAFLTPIVFGIETSFETIGREWVKLVVLALYFYLGYNLSERYGLTLYGFYSTTAILLAGVGFILQISDVNALNETLFYGERYRGFMNDPNYYGIILVSALPWLLRTQGIPVIVRMLGGVVVFLGVAQTGSKTAALTFIIYLVVVVIAGIARSSSAEQAVRRLMLNLMVPVVVAFFGWPVLLRLMEALSASSPGAERISLVFIDFEASLTDQGSSRDLAWDTAFAIWNHSPFLGIGVGPYGQVAESISGIPIIAHNTYIQLAVEWGTIWTIAFLAIVALLLVNTARRNVTHYHAISHDIILILLIGSLAISLNNVRVLWIALGVIARYIELRTTSSEYMSQGRLANA